MLAAVRQVRDRPVIILGVVNAAFADGSTRTISEDVDYHVYQSLLTPHNATSDMPDLDYRLTEDDFLQ